MKEFLLALAKTNLPAFAIINSSLKKELLSYREDAAKQRDTEQTNRDVLHSMHVLGGGAGRKHHTPRSQNPFVWHTLDGVKHN